MADVLVYSYEVGIEKPDRRIYEFACERPGVRPSEVVFLDDLETNVAAARRLGMRAVLFQSTAQAIADVEACLVDSAG
jgi:epoxide hydrolase-like predicted phosphatase